MGYRYNPPFLEDVLPISDPGSRNTFWIATCPKHGETDHLSYLGGACTKCHQEGLEAQGLVAKDNRR